MKNSKKLTPNQMYERLNQKCFDWWTPKTNCFFIQFEEGGRVYKYNQPLYEVAYKCKAINYEEYILFCANDARVCPHEFR